MHALRFIATLSRGMLVLTLLLGTPTWLALRAMRSESMLSYSVAGALEALCCSLWLSMSFNSAFRSDQIPTFLMLGLIGAALGAAFWLIARSRPSLQLPP